MRGVDINIEEVNIFRKGENVMVLASTVNYSDVSEEQRTSGFQAGLTMLVRNSDEEVDFNGFYSVIVKEEDDEKDVTLARMPGLDARWGGNLPWWWEHRIYPNDGKIPVFDQDGMYLGSLFWWEIP